MPSILVNPLRETLDCLELLEVLVGPNKQILNISVLYIHIQSLIVSCYMSEDVYLPVKVTDGSLTASPGSPIPTGPVGPGLPWPPFSPF